MSDDKEIDDLQREVLLLKLAVANLGQQSFEQRRETQRVIQVLLDVRSEMKDVRADYRKHFRRARMKLDKLMDAMLKQEPADDWWRTGESPPWQGGDDGE